MNESAIELFRKACGLDAPLTLECQGPYQAAGLSTPYHFVCPFVLIGRDPRSDVVLNDSHVSRRHALLQVIGGQLFCVDLLSRTKLLWDSEQDPQARGWLAQGRNIRVGPYAIRWVGQDPIESSSPELPDPFSFLQTERCSLPSAALELPIRLGEGVSLWPLESRLALVGRSDISQLILSDDSISKLHACLVRTPLGVWVVDLLSREGILVNGIKVRWAWLEDGDILRIGTFTFILRYETAPEQISRRDVPIDAGTSSATLARTESSARRGESGSRGRSLAVRSKVGSSPPAQVARSSASFSPAVLVSSGDPAWEQALQVAPGYLAMWQQQMQLMESFHNDMILMVQMFVAMHREHLASVRDELNRVQQLTQELSTLHEKLALDAAVADGVSRPTKVDGVSLDAALRQAPHAQKKSGIRVVEEQGSTGKEAFQESQESPASVHAPRVPDPIASVAKHLKQPSEDRSSPADHTELHGLLAKRITELQRERQGYWQKILSVISK